MLRFAFTKAELEDLKSKIYLSEIQERIIIYRMKDYSIAKMAELEKYSTSYISKEIDKIGKKIKKVM